MGNSEKAAAPDLYTIRHSLAHILAQAVLEIRPGSKLGFGPPIDDGFYYDFILSAPITEADFSEIEKKMKHLIRQGHKFEKENLPYSDAMARLDQMGEPYKKEYANELFEKQSLSDLTFYKSGTFVDMCEGPHVENSRQIPADGFKLRSVSGAYWRGDSKNQSMTRIYAWAFATRAELDAHLAAFKLALERDHKKLGKELDIYHIDDAIGKGLPLWLPNGTVVRDELEALMKELEFKAGFQRVATPHLAKADLYYTTGHLPYYAKHMFPMMEVSETHLSEDGKSEETIKETYSLKPMNCPHHHKIFSARLRSYRDLPMRLAEYGQVYRFEDSGALAGLLRVRGMCMNDAHIYCTEDQVEEEMLAVIEMHREVYKILGIENSYSVRFSTWDSEDPKGKEKYVDNPDAWERTQAIVLKAIQKSGLPFTEGKGEAAFYGPKIDFQFKSVTGREETASTCQLDFAIPERMDLKYRASDNSDQRPLIIHRAPLGTHERFVAFLIEQYGGAFPTWLAPMQVRIIPINDQVLDYARMIEQRLRGQMVRIEVDASSETLNKRIRTAVTQKVPNVLVIGEREKQEEKITLRRYGVEAQQNMALGEFETWVLNQIKTRARS
jgi:threonyl-tRNA synthetase